MHPQDIKAERMQLNFHVPESGCLLGRILHDTKTNSASDMFSRLCMELVLLMEGQSTICLVTYWGLDSVLAMWTLAC
jgi:hypothetical protein